MHLHRVTFSSAISDSLCLYLALLAGVLLCALAAPAVHAQGVSFAYAKTILDSNAYAVWGVAVDSNGNVFFSHGIDFLNPASDMSEVMAVDAVSAPALRSVLWSTNIRST